MEAARLALQLPLLLLVALTFYPFVFLVQTSLKDNNQFFHDFWGRAPLPLGQLYAGLDAIKLYVATPWPSRSPQSPDARRCGSLRYTFARHKFPGREALFYAILSLMMVRAC